MPRQFFKRISLKSHHLKEHKSLKFFGKLLHNENLWHINRNSVSLAFAIGLFSAFVPIPFQMVLAAALAIFIHANLPIAVSLVWITNPLTMPPIFFYTYKLGCLILSIQPTQWHTDFALHSLANELSHIWKPLFLGSILSGLIAGLLGYVIVRVIWRIRVMVAWKRRGQQAPN